MSHETMKPTISPYESLQIEALIDSAVDTEETPSFNPANGIQLFEDFVSGGYAAASSSTVIFGALGWSYVGNGTCVYSTIWDENHPGIMNLGTGAGATFYTVLGTGAKSTQGVWNSSGSWTIGASDSFTMHWWVRFPTLSDATQRYSSHIGFGDQTNALPNGGIYFLYDEATSPNWQIATAHGGTRTTTTTSTAVPADTWTKLTITLASGTVEYFVDGVSVGTINTNLPTAQTGIKACIIKSVGTTERIVKVDAMYLDYTFGTAR